MIQKFFALVALLALVVPSAYAEQDQDVTIQRNPDGTIETYDTKDGPLPSSQDGGGSRVKPVHSYTKKTSDGIHFKRNPDGSIETWEDDEPMPRAHSSSVSKTKKKTSAKKTTSTSTVKKKAK